MLITYLAALVLVDEKTLANRTKMSKFGVQVAEISIFFRRQTQ